MPRKPRVFVEGGLYHVYNRASRGDPILESASMAKRFVGLLSQAVRRHESTVLAWALMPNHYHVVLRSGVAPLSKTFGGVQGRFGQYYNRVHRSKGPLWQNRYQAILIEEESYLYQLVAYVHLNPVAAGLVDDPADWEWSGHRELVRKTVEPLINVESVLAMYGDTFGSGQENYIRSIQGARDEAWIGGEPGKLPWWGHEPDSPVEIPRPPAWVDERGVSTGLDRPNLSAATFIEAACKLENVVVEDLASKRRGEFLTRVRLLISNVGIERWRQSPIMMAETFGRHPDVITRWSRKGAERRLVDREFSGSVSRLDIGLVKLDLGNNEKS